MMDVLTPTAGFALFGRIVRWLTRYRMEILPFDQQDHVKIWAFPGEPIEQRKFANLQVCVRSGTSAKRCVAIAEVHQISPIVGYRGKFALHWADIEYKFRTTGAEAADIGAEGRRLDVAFSFPGQPGCFMATTGALAAPGLRGEDYLAPGDYVLRVTVRSDNVHAVATTLNLRSPTLWNELQVWSGVC